MPGHSIPHGVSCASPPSGHLAYTEDGHRRRWPSLYTPGHTSGGLTLVLDSGEAIVGDLIGSDMHAPSLAELAMFAVDSAVMADSVRRVLALDPDTVYCGHGGPFGTEQLKRLAPSV